jgi:hypothetical protein
MFLPTIRHLRPDDRSQRHQPRLSQRNTLSANDPDVVYALQPCNWREINIRILNCKVNQLTEDHSICLDSALWSLPSNTSLVVLEWGDMTVALLPRIGSLVAQTQWSCYVCDLACMIRWQWALNLISAGTSWLHHQLTNKTAYRSQNHLLYSSL